MEDAVKSPSCDTIAPAPPITKQIIEKCEIGI